MAKSKFYVQLSEVKPKPRPDCPMIPIEAPGKYEAEQEYRKMCGIRATERPFEIYAENEPIPDYGTGDSKVTGEARKKAANDFLTAHLARVKDTERRKAKQDALEAARDRE